MTASTNKIELELERMTVHLFGAVSSQGCANFTQKHSADDGEVEFGLDAADTVRNSFYVDDGLKGRRKRQSNSSIMLRASVPREVSS